MASTRLFWIPMTPHDALQVLIICHAKGAGEGDFPRPKDFGEAIRNGFVRQEGNDLVRELSLADGQGTGAAVRLFFADSTDTLPQPQELDTALHTLVVLLVTWALIEDDPVIARLEAIALIVKSSSKRHGLLILGASEDVLSHFRKKTGIAALKDPQGWSVEKLGEYALRPAYAAMLALNRAHQQLANDETLQGDPKYHNKARFFISHAKLDGLPLAQALSHVIANLDWLEQFYDAKDILPGDDFKEILERGILGSMVLVLRTDIYDLRHWCRQEVMWAEEHDRPVLLVDARTQLSIRPSVLGFTGVPTVRIPDGNLVRVLLEAFQEWVRIGVLHRRFAEVVKPGTPLSETTEFLSRPPTLTSLAESIKRLRKRCPPGATVQVVYSEPPLENKHSAAAQDMIHGIFAGGSVVSFKTFIAQLP